jgi:pyruvate, water dikinase
MPTILHEAHDEAHFGGKAVNLGASLRAGLPVPPGFAIRAASVEAIVAGEEAAREQLHQRLSALGGPVAVRSSGIGEDSEAASFAGQHLTFLNRRTPGDVEEAVARVHASAHTESALAYRRKLGLAGAPRIAVVVQRMVEPDCAGVMFTRNPLDGADQRVIEAAWGLGEAVVAGLVVPDNYVLSRDGQLITRRIGEKDLALRSRDEGGTIEEEVAPGLIHAPCLDAEMLARLHALASRCEVVFGHALDLEWAFAGSELYLLQARPMTRTG